MLRIVVVFALLSLMDKLQALDCAKFKSNCPGTPRKGAHTEDSVCLGETCPQCLSGPEWSKFLSDLGAGSVNRTLTPRLMVGDWLSFEITSTIATILLKEGMGFRVNNFNQVFGAPDMLCCPMSPDEIFVILETWLSRGQVDGKNSHPDITYLGVGYNGQSGLYVPKHTLEKNPMMTASNSYRYLDYGSVVDKAFSTPCEELRKNASLPCEESNYVCEASIALWKGLGPACQQGRYVPPQCEGKNAAYCQEILGASPSWDQGFFEGLLNNSGLNFSFAYLGGGNLPKVLMRKKKAKEDFIFYWFSPDPLVAILGAEPIMFKPYTEECAQKRTTFPYTNRNDCGYPSIPLTKIARRDRLQDADRDFQHFFNSILFLDSQIFAMMQAHTTGGGTKNIFEVACSWVKENRDIWKDWIKNTKESQASSPQVIVAESTEIDVVVGPIAGIVALLLIVFFVYVWYQRGELKRRTRDVSHASKGRTAIIFTDVQNSTGLWESQPRAMRSAIELHHKAIRQVIAKHKAYEVKTIGDSFMISVKDADDAVRVLNDIHSELLVQPWPAEILDTLDACVKFQGKTLVFKGLRVRMGADIGNPEVMYDEVSKG